MEIEITNSNNLLENLKNNIFESSNQITKL